MPQDLVILQELICFHGHWALFLTHPRLLEWLSVGEMCVFCSFDKSLVTRLHWWLRRYWCTNCMIPLTQKMRLLICSNFAYSEDRWKTNSHWSNHMGRLYNMLRQKLCDICSIVRLKVVAMSRERLNVCSPFKCACMWSALTWFTQGS